MKSLCVLSTLLHTDIHPSLVTCMSCMMIDGSRKLHHVPLEPCVLALTGAMRAAFRRGASGLRVFGMVGGSFLLSAGTDPSVAYCTPPSSPRQLKLLPARWLCGSPQIQLAPASVWPLGTQPRSSRITWFSRKALHSLTRGPLWIGNFQPVLLQPLQPLVPR